MGNVTQTGGGVDFAEKIFEKSGQGSVHEVILYRI
jgi:hypothetical protein